MAEAVYITILGDLVSFDAIKDLQALSRVNDGKDTVRVTLNNGATYLLQGAKDLYQKLYHAMNYGVKNLETR